MSEPREPMTLPAARRDNLLAILLAGVAGFIRLIPYLFSALPHAFNMTPMNALGVFGGARLPFSLAMTLPLMVMVVSDLAILALKGPDWKPFNLFVYVAFLLSVLLGRLLTQAGSAFKIGAVALLVSLQFFLITNFGSWLDASRNPERLPPGAAFYYDMDSPFPNDLIRYARTPAGLVACYAHGISFAAKDRAKAPPFGFFGNLVVGDLFFTGLLFGAHVVLGRRFGRLAAVPSALSSGQPIREAMP